MRTRTRFCSIGTLPWLALVATVSAGEPVAAPLAVKIAASHGPQRPAAVPIVPGLSVGKQVFYGPLVGRPAAGKGYQPVDGDSFAIHNGPGTHNFILTSGMWWLRVGDRPSLAMTVRSGAGAYAPPALLPDIGFACTWRLSVESAGKKKWLDQFDSIDAVLSPGSARWTCRDKALGASVALAVRPLIHPWGFAATAEVSAAKDGPVTLTWELVDKAKHAADKGDIAEFTSGKYGRILAGWVKTPGRVENGRLTAQLALAAGTPQTAAMLCVAGYSDYNRQGVAEAWKRLEFRPFDATWLAAMKPKWFDHWIGGGLEPEKKFRDAREQFDAVVRESREFWARHRGRMHVKTPDPRLDNVINHVSAQARVQFEYPAFIHGLGYAKYGKISHGYYGFEAAGMHEEAADSLHFVAGTQDPKGRQRYFMTTFAVSNWHEDMDFYFPEQCWHHWRWTGDVGHLRAIWPAARRALEHGLATSDPDGDGLMTGYYEMWNADQNNPGGYSALQTAMGYAALRAGRDMAAALGDRDYPGRSGAALEYDPVYSRRYQQLADLTQKQYLARLWHNDVGAWSSAEVNGVNRPRPHTCEQNYAIPRGLGDHIHNYMAMRFVRENYHRRDLQPGSTFEFINDWWPIQWSHHYVAGGDTCASFHSACSAGDVDGHWPALKTVAESAYLNSGSLWQGTGSNTAEMEPLFLHAVVDGLFGVQPWFGENLLVLRPSPPTGWDRLEMRHVDVQYQWRRSRGAMTLDVTTPVARRVRAELLIRDAVQRATVDGVPAKFTLEKAVGAARVVIDAPAARRHRFEIVLAGGPPAVEGDLRAVAGCKAGFSVRGAVVAAVHDPQQAVRDLSLTRRASDSTAVQFVAVRPGKPTVFLELRCGDTAWLHPLDLDVRQPWTLVERFVPGLNPGGPAVASPAIDVGKKALTLEIANGANAELAGPATITVARQSMVRDVKLAPFGTVRLTIPLDAVWERLSPGSVPVRVWLAGRDETKDAVHWSPGKPSPAVAARFRPVDLRPHANVAIDKVYSPATQWRIDYTGAQHGVDWRHPLPPCDRFGYVIYNSVMSVFDYGTLPEQVRPVKRIALAPPQPMDAVAGVPLCVPPGRILAVCCTEPHAQFPSSVCVDLPEPRRLEKLYLLTGNIVKTLKCYYPGGEIVVRYADGGRAVHPLIPPYTMPSVVGNICPRARVISIGKLVGDGNPVADTRCYLSLTDLALDLNRPIAGFDIRCTATETLLGVAGLTLLEAEKQ